MTPRGQILQVLACCELATSVAVWIGAGVWVSGERLELLCLLFLFSVFLLLTRPLWSFLVVLSLWNLWDLNLDFHGHVEPCRTCRLYSDIALVVYIYVCGSANPCGCRLWPFVSVLCFFWVVWLVSDFLVENELNLLSSITST